MTEIQLRQHSILRLECFHMPVKVSLDHCIKPNTGNLITYMSTPAASELCLADESC